ncbi:hypothetical protein [Enterococcus plantarum]|uniref:hypothetical protein n=1 Tax=Enterococcus plantarum TaxID=1077675 RepID=UPI001A8C3ECE|nr:hypothetical protein [Enterococcus plantarum]MBO0422695.1 hypothetical protein [Enterococcus plantarum]
MSDQFGKPCRLSSKLNRFSPSTECSIEFSNGAYINGCVRDVKSDPLVISKLDEFVVEHFSTRYRGQYYNELLCSTEEKPMLILKG